MKLRRTKIFVKRYRKLPEATRKKLDRQLKYLSTDIRHPGLRAKRMQGIKDIWEGRVDIQYRFTFQIVDDLIILRTVGPHDVLDNP